MIGVHIPFDLTGLMSLPTPDGHDTAAPFVIGTDTSAAIAPHVANAANAATVSNASFGLPSLADVKGLGITVAQYSVATVLGLALVIGGLFVLLRPEA